jgi:hypothetical protein
MLKQAGLYDIVEMRVEGDKLVIQATHKPRQVWEAKFAEMAEHIDDRLLDDYFPNEWDVTEWDW